MNIGFNRLLSATKTVNITTTAINEGSAWGTSGEVLQVDDIGVLLEENMTSPYDSSGEKKTRLAYFPWANIACISERK